MAMILIKRMGDRKRWQINTTQTDNLMIRPPEILMRHNREVLSIIWTQSSDDKGKHGTPY